MQLVIETPTLESLKTPCFSTSQVSEHTICEGLNSFLISEHVQLALCAHRFPHLYEFNQHQGTRLERKTTEQEHTSIIL